MSFPEFGERLAAVRERIDAAARRAGRDPSAVTVIAVTKAHDFAAMTCALDHGLHDLGENRVQEALPKIDRLDHPQARVHLIGRLQTNKASRVVGRFASIMSVDRASLLDRITRRAAELGIVQPVWIQVNCSGEAQKGGAEPAAAAALVADTIASDALQLCGLMTMGRAGAGEAELRRSFSLLRELRDSHCPGSSLSMGMSGDYGIAVEEGATHLRIGTALFGARH